MIMDYADNFNPKPIKGEQYTTSDGKVVVVDDIQSDEGVVYVFCHYVGDDPCTLYPNKEEWEAMFASDDVTSGADDDAVSDNSVTDGDSDKSDKTKDDDNSKHNVINTGKKNDSDDDFKENVDEPSHDDETSDLLLKILEPINKLRELLKNGVTLPFQILKLESDEEIPAPFSDPNLTKTCQEELNRIQKLRKEGEKEENYGSWVEEKMWSFGAFDKPMLRMFRQDHGAKTGLGAAIFMTALLACFTGTYAAYKISGNTFLAFIIGLVWGTMIYVLDRNIVTSMAYTGNKNKFQNFLKSLCTVGLRLVISIFIGIVIAAPIEMLIFGGKIEEFKNFEHEQFIKNEIANQQYEISKDLIEKKGRIDKELAEIRERLDWEESNPYAPSRGSKWRAYNAKETKILERSEQIQNELDKLPLIYETKRKDFLEKAENKWKKHADFFDLSTDLSILYKVTAKVNDIVLTGHESIVNQNNPLYADSTKLLANKFNESKDSLTPPQNAVFSAVANNAEINPALPVDNTMFYCRIFITIFFTLLEVIPVITKLFFKAGDYDKIMVRWRYLNGKLQRIENASSHNQTINGPLSAHRKYILGEEFDDIDGCMQTDINSNNEDKDDINDITLPVKGCLRTAKDYIEWRNLRRWKSTLEDVDAYLAAEIKKLLPLYTTPSIPSQPVPSQTSPSTDDPSAVGEDIK